MAEGGMVCFFGGFGLLVGLVLGAALLRAAVSVANKVFRPPDPADLADWDWDPTGEWEAEERKRLKKVKAVPEPGMGKGMGIALAIGATTAVVATVLAVFAQAVAEDAFDGHEAARAVVLALFTLPFAFLGTALLLTAMLPTTFGRAALVALLYHLFALTLVGGIGGTIATLLSL